MSVKNLPKLKFTNLFLIL